jgi:hypothetical protein
MKPVLRRPVESAQSSSISALMSSGSAQNRRTAAPETIAAPERTMRAASFSLHPALASWARQAS